MTRSRRRRNSERGSAMLVTLIVISALLAGGAVLVSLQTAGNRSVDLTRSGTSALYCAEAGLSAARPVVANSYALWGGWLAASGTGGLTTEPADLYALIGNHDLDGVTGDDFEVYIKDNGDEGTAADNPDIDTDQQVFIVVKCLTWADTQKAVSELVLYNGAAPCYPGQQGGCDGDGN